MERGFWKNTLSFLRTSNYSLIVREEIQSDAQNQLVEIVRVELNVLVYLEIT